MSKRRAQRERGKRKQQSPEHVFSQPMVEVLTGEFKELKREGTLFTSGIATCIGVAIYSPREKKGILGHFNDNAISEGLFDKMLEACYSGKTRKDLSDNTVWVGGGELLTSNIINQGLITSEKTIDIANDITLKNRSTILDGIAYYILAQADYQKEWQTYPSTVNVYLDVADGTRRVQVTNE